MTDTAPKPDFSAAARDYAAQAIKTAQERAEALNAGVEKATSQLESGVHTASTTLAEASRNVQGAIYEDVKATLGAIEKIASAKSLAEAAQIHVQYLGDRSQVSLARMTKATEYLARALQDGARSAQDAIARMAARNDKAA
jgi:hypothetical protein